MTEIAEPQEKSARVVNFGCRLNAFESQVMRENAAAAGLNDTIIVNSCAVTAKTERQVRQQIRKLRRENPKARIVVTGCAVQIKPETYGAMPEIDHLIGNGAKLKSKTFENLASRPRMDVEDIMQAGEAPHPMVRGFEGIARAYVQVQQGCDHRCTFCIIPFGRGPSRSVPVETATEHVRRLVAEGYREIVLTGVDIASYGVDLPGKPRLGRLLRHVLAAHPGLARLRLSSIDPAGMDEEFWHLIAHEKRLMPHLHLSLQAGDNIILKRMKRRHRSDDILRLIERARTSRPDMVFGADVITGFPTESDAMFENTKALIETAGITWLHVFPFSPRHGTPASRMPQIPERIRTERAAILREVGEKAALRHLEDMQGKNIEVLVEKNEAGRALGRTPHYAQVAFTSAHPAGALTMLRMAGRTGGRLLGEETRRAA